MLNKLFQFSSLLLTYRALAAAADGAGKFHGSPGPGCVNGCSCVLSTVLPPATNDSGHDVSLLTQQLFAFYYFFASFFFASFFGYFTVATWSQRPCDFYVGLEGDDAEEGGEAEYPKKTLTCAVRLEIRTIVNMCF